MSGDKGRDGLPYGLGDVLGRYGLGGVVLVLGIVLVGLSIYQGPSFAAGLAQLSAIIGGSVLGLVVIVIGIRLLSRGEPAVRRPVNHDVYIAAPMAGFG